MMFLLAVAIIAAAAEFGMYQYATPGKKLLPIAITGLVLLTNTGLLVIHWPVWVIAWLFGLYRCVNVLRFAAGRLPTPELRSISLRAAAWLVPGQVAFTLASAFFVDLKHGTALLFTTGLLQLSAAMILLRSTIHTWRHTRPVLSARALTDKQLPSLSVLVPARNETAELEACLTSILASDYPKLEVIVYDDNSANRRTPEIIKAFAHDGVRFIPGNEPDLARWLPKNYAYEQLRAEASGDVLLFCGVDIRLAAESLRHLVEVMTDRQKTMLSVLPLRDVGASGGFSLLQPMRYYWELCLPRRIFKRPPVLSSCWLILADKLEKAGGFQAVSRSIVPESHFARQAVVEDSYGFIRADENLGIMSTKPSSAQYDTTIRMRYPQLHRRLELVAVSTLAELIWLLGPLVGVLTAWRSSHALSLSLLYATSCVVLLAVYYYVAVETRLNKVWTWWLQYPVAILADVIMLHVSLLCYEFGSVTWKGRNVGVPVMHLPSTNGTGAAKR